MKKDVLRFCENQLRGTHREARPPGRAEARIGKRRKLPIGALALRSNPKGAVAPEGQSYWRYSVLGIRVSRLRL